MQDSRREEQNAHTSMGDKRVGDDLLESVGQRQVGNADIFGAEAVARLPRLLVHVSANSRHRSRVVSVR